MALDYFFCMQPARQALSADAVHDALIREAGLRRSGTSPILDGEHVQASVLPPEAGSREVRVLFRIDKADPAVGEDEMLGLVLRLVERFQPDAQLTFQLEDKILAIAGGSMSVPEDQEFWTEARLARLPAR